MVPPEKRIILHLNARQENRSFATFVKCVRLSELSTYFPKMETSRVYFF